MNTNSIIKPSEAAIIGFSPQTGKSFPPYVRYSEDNRVLRPAEASALIDYAEREGFVYDSVEQHTYCDVSLLKMDRFENDFRWLYFLTVQRFHWANELYNFDLSGIIENLKIVKFEPNDSAKEATARQNFNRTENPIAPNRKLIGYINLSDGIQYKGCDLFLINSGQNMVTERGIGDMVIYPAWTPNYFSPITKGVRYVIQAIASGPAFR